MTLAIFVEGPSDKYSIPVLVRRLGHTRIEVRIVPRGDMLDVDEVERHVTGLKQMHPEVAYVMICMDSEYTDPEQTLGNAQAALRSLRDRLGGVVAVDYAIVDHSIEGWLGCDVDSLRGTLGRDARLLGGPKLNYECRPAQALSRIFKVNGRDFRKTSHNRLLAQRVDLDLLRRESETFSQFAKLLEDNLKE